MTGPVSPQPREQSGRGNSRWAPQPNLTWLRDGAGPIYVAVFHDLRPRVLEEPTATIWEILLHAWTESERATSVEEILLGLEKAGILSPEQRAEPSIRGDVAAVLEQLELMGAINRVDR